MAQGPGSTAHTSAAPVSCPTPPPCQHPPTSTHPPTHPPTWALRRPAARRMGSEPHVGWKQACRRAGGAAVMAQLAAQHSRPSTARCRRGSPPTQSRHQFAPSTSLPAYHNTSTSQRAQRVSAPERIGASQVPSPAQEVLGGVCCKLGAAQGVQAERIRVLQYTSGTRSGTVSCRCRARFRSSTNLLEMPQQRGRMATAPPEPQGRTIRRGLHATATTAPHLVLLRVEVNKQKLALPVSPGGRLPPSTLLPARAAVAVPLCSAERQYNQLVGRARWDGSQGLQL